MYARYTIQTGQFKISANLFVVSISYYNCNNRFFKTRIFNFIFFYLGVFNESVGNISDKYFLELTPSSYVFGTIWPIIFLWTIVGKIYLVVSLFLPDNKSPVKIIPAFTPMVSNKIRFNCSATLPALSW